MKLRPRVLSPVVGILLALAALRLIAPQLCSRDAAAWFRGDEKIQRRLADYLVAFEARDDTRRRKRPKNRFAGEWALVTHQMTALGLSQLVLAHPELKARYLPTISKAAEKTFLREMRTFGSRAWRGEDVMSSLSSSHGHAYMSYPALAVGAARLVGAPLSERLLRDHDRLIAAYVRRLSRARHGLIETYPQEAYPTDVAAVAGAIALHGRVTGKDYSKLLKRWAAALRRHQIHSKSGFVHQRMGARNGKPRDAPRGSGTALAAYFAGFADGETRALLTNAVMAHEASFFGFGAIREYAEGFSGSGDVDSGPVIAGVSVAATGFALSLARTPTHRDAFERLMRTTTLFGVPANRGDAALFASGGPIGNALLLAMLTSGPEVAP